MAPPKRPPSAFFLFASEVRPEIKKTSESKGVGAIAKIVAQRWRDLEESKKQEYFDKYQKLKKQYNEDLAKWHENNEGVKRPAGNDRQLRRRIRGGEPAAKRKRVSQSKRGPTGYTLYITENKDRAKKENPDVAGHKIRGMLSAEWNRLSEEKKAKYQKKALKERKRIRREQNDGDASESDGSSDESGSD